MSGPEQPSLEANEHDALLRQLAELRAKVHSEMEEELKKRLEKEPAPSEDELRMAAFMEWLEPQVRDACRIMFEKGYASMSSGFYGENNDFQAIDGYFKIDPETKAKIEALGVEVLGGAEIGVPKNKWITQLRFYPKNADLAEMKKIWDAVAEVLPVQKGPAAVCDRAEEFREKYAPEHPSLQKEFDEYWMNLQKSDSDARGDLV